MRPISKFEENGRICTERLIVMAKPLILCCQSNAIPPRHEGSLVEQDHRFIKKITRPMLGFKAFYSAAATLAGIETAHMIRKGQLGQNGVSPFKQFAALNG